MPVILVVEDEAEVSEMLVELIGQHGYEARVARTAAEAATIAKSERPDAILLDMILPDGRGTMVLDYLRTLRPDVPVVMVTANDDEELARQTLKRGAIDYIMKPFNVTQLTLVLEVALAR